MIIYDGGGVYDAVIYDQSEVMIRKSSPVLEGFPQLASHRRNRVNIVDFSKFDDDDESVVDVVIRQAREEEKAGR